LRENAWVFKSADSQQNNSDYVGKKNEDRYNGWKKLSLEQITYKGECGYLKEEKGCHEWQDR